MADRQNPEHGPRPSESPGPVLLLADTGLIIRNLLLGTFGRTVAARKKLLVAVGRPQDPRLRAVTRELGDVELIAFERRQQFLPGDLPGRLTAWESYIPRWLTAGKTVRARDSLRRRSDSGHSFAGQLYVDAVYGVGALLQRGGLMPRVEARYLRSLRRQPITRAWRRVLEQHRPSAVVSTALSLAKLRSHSHDLPPVLAALELGIPCGTLIQSWDNLSSKPGLFPPELDRLWTWSAEMSRELLELHPHLSADKVVEVGSLQFDFHRSYADGELSSREHFCRQLDFDPGRPIILIGTGTPNRLPYEHLAVVDLVERLERAAPACQCLVRLHPKDYGERWRELEPKIRRLGAKLQRTMPAEHMDHGGFVPPNEFFKDQISTIQHCAVIVNSASTLTVDGAILGRPSICLGYDLERDQVFPEGRAYACTLSTHFARLVATGGTKVVSSPEQCVAAILERLDDPSLESEGRQQIVRLVSGEVDGKAGERLAQEVLALADSADHTPV